MAPRRPAAPGGLTERLALLERRLRRLERSGDTRVPVASAPGRHPLFEVVRARAGRPPRAGRGGGLAGYAGVVYTPDGRTYHWQGEHPVERLLAMEWEALARGFAALGHRVRLELLRALLNGVHDAGALQKLAGMGTTGQLYHHLRELQATGWVRQQQRNRYMVVPDRVVCALIMVGALAGPDSPSPPRTRAARTPRRKTP